MNRGSLVSAAVIGAGPYGLSVAAHLRSAGIEIRIFGKPMSRWRHQMPKGMFLKSEGFASNLSDPGGQRTLARYCADWEISYGDAATPVPLEVFTRYALAFQQNYVPTVEPTMVSGVEKSHGRFELRLANGEVVWAQAVIVATGLEHADYIPAEFQHVPPELLSHSSQHHDLSRFKGEDVIVLGAGQSALETAALLHELGACVRLLARAPSVSWNSVPKTDPRSLYERLRYPTSGLGAGLQAWAYANTPWAFRYLPRTVRFERLRRVLGPAGAWWLKDRVICRIPILLNCTAAKVEVHGGRVELQVHRPGGRTQHFTTNHVIAATGYRFSVNRLPFLGESLKAQLRTEHLLPALSRHFESSVSGLYFTGLASAPSFGPAMRFLEGTRFTSDRVSRHVAAGLLQKTIEPSVQFAH